MVVDIKSFIVAGNEKHNDKYSYTKFEYLGHGKTFTEYKETI